MNAPTRTMRRSNRLFRRRKNETSFAGRSWASKTSRYSTYSGSRFSLRASPFHLLCFLLLDSINSPLFRLMFFYYSPILSWSFDENNLCVFPRIGTTVQQHWKMLGKRRRSPPRRARKMLGKMVREQLSVCLSPLLTAGRRCVRVSGRYWLTPPRRRHPIWIHFRLSNYRFSKSINSLVGCACADTWPFKWNQGDTTNV